ncbi:MAG: phytoene/squalene synthase family protein [Candidatus Kapaibacteriota bacterium]
MEVLKQSSLAAFEQEPLTKTETSNFNWAFNMLSKEKRNAIYTIYNFLSYLDNIVDSKSVFSPKSNVPKADFVAKKLERIHRWEETLINIYDDNKSISDYLSPLRFVIKRFNIPMQYFQTLLNGFKRDLTQNTYETFEELKNYCFDVASVVGLIVIEIFGYKYETTKSYAINLGYALQLTNILRDVKFDKDRGYIYLPLEDLSRFDYSIEDLKNEVYNENFIELMNFEAQRAKEYYFKARSYLKTEERKNMIAAGIMDEIYYRLLEKIELKEYKVFHKKIKVSNIHKLMIAIKHLLSVQLFVNRIKKLP